MLELLPSLVYLFSSIYLSSRSSLVNGQRKIFLPIGSVRLMLTDYPGGTQNRNLLELIKRKGVASTE